MEPGRKQARLAIRTASVIAAVALLPACADSTPQVTIAESDSLTSAEAEVDANSLPEEAATDAPSVEPYHRGLERAGDVLADAGLTASPLSEVAERHTRAGPANAQGDDVLDGYTVIAVELDESDFDSNRLSFRAASESGAPEQDWPRGEAYRISSSDSSLQYVLLVEEPSALINIIAYGDAASDLPVLAREVAEGL